MKKKKDRNGLESDSSGNVRLTTGQKMRASLRQSRFKPEYRISSPSPEILQMFEALGKKAKTKTVVDDSEAAHAAKAEYKKLLSLVAECATGLWRIRKKMLPDGEAEPAGEMRKLFRYVESAWESLKAAQVEVRDYTGEKYVNGMVLRARAFQPTEGIHTKVIDETIKPAVFYKKGLIQLAEVIVAVPIDSAEKNESEESPESQ